MIKKLGVAAACGIALYGLAKLVNRHLVVVLNGSVEFPIDATNDTELSRNLAIQDPGCILGAATSLGEVVSDEAVGSCAGLAAAQQVLPVREAPCL